MGVIIVQITNFLDEDPSNESIGYGDLSLDYCVTGYDVNSGSCCHESCTNGCTGSKAEDCVNWFNDCDATETNCDIYTYYGQGQCG
ncbi:MAG: hypothetical protein QF535_14930 [Anaerolineales bacterium]|nr:hypothetical protein [Anaerolineales bacterium]